MRVGIIGLMHESNTFLPSPTTIDNFKQWHLLSGEAVRDAYEAAHHEMGGFFAGLKAAGIDAVPIFGAWAMPSGRVTAATFDELVGRIMEGLDRAGPLDGLLVAPHGAGSSDEHRDMDGQWLTLVREKVGPDLPIMGTLDPHANVSQRMVDACDALTAYRSNPHLDQRDRGLEAASLLARKLRGEIKPVMTAAFPPISINIERQLTTASPCRELYAVADRQLKLPGVLSNSVVLGFPYTDCEEMGTSFLVVTDNDPTLGRKLVNELADYLWGHRAEFVGNLLSIDAAVARSKTVAGPVGLLDMGDNVGGGSPGDSTEIFHGLIRAGVTNSLAALADADSEAKARAAGVGKRVRLSIGGKVDPSTGAPIDAEVTVVSLHDGKFGDTAVRHGGQVKYDMGPTAVVKLDSGQTILITSRRMAPFSLGQITSCGLDPKSFQAIVIKGVHAPVAAYAPVCSELIRVDTPGVTCADMTKLTFHHRRKPLFPFEDNFSYTAWS